jgi:hypothetical protein
VGGTGVTFYYICRILRFIYYYNEDISIVVCRYMTVTPVAHIVSLSSFKNNIYCLYILIYKSDWVFENGHFKNVQNEKPEILS